MTWDNVRIAAAVLAVALGVGWCRDVRAEGLPKDKSSPLGFLPIGEMTGKSMNWAGFYIGAHGGWASSDIDFPGAPAHPAGPPRQTLEGGIVGGHIGYNWQINSLVLGIEADVSWGDLGGTVKDGNYLTETQSVDWMGSVRGRLGYSFGRFLPYLTAGIMWDRSSAGAACPSGAKHGMCKYTGAFDVSDTQIHQGYVWGGGFDYALTDRMSLRFEALYADMGEKTYDLGGSPWKVEHDLTIVRGGINFKLN